MTSWARYEGREDPFSVTGAIPGARQRCQNGSEVTVHRDPSPPGIEGLLVTLSRRWGVCGYVAWDVGPVGYACCLSVKIFVCVMRLPCGCCFQPPVSAYSALLHQMFCYLRFLELMIWERGMGAVWLTGSPRGERICN